MLSLTEYALKTCIMCRGQLLVKVDGPIACPECLEERRTARELLRECINWHQEFISAWRHYSYLKMMETNRKPREPKKHIIQRRYIGEVELD